MVKVLVPANFWKVIFISSYPLTTNSQTKKTSIKIFIQFWIIALFFFLVINLKLVPKSLKYYGNFVKFVQDFLKLNQISWWNQMWFRSYYPQYTLQYSVIYIICDVKDFEAIMILWLGWGLEPVVLAAKLEKMSEHLLNSEILQRF